MIMVKAAVKNVQNKYYTLRWSIVKESAVRVPNQSPAGIHFIADLVTHDKR
jgi:hypothetical protein